MTEFRMHPVVEDIWKKHAAWLEEGGINAVQVIREMNLIAFMTQGVERAEAAVQAEAYRRGHRDGYKKALADAQKAKGDQADPAPAPPEPPPVTGFEALSKP